MLANGRGKLRMSSNGQNQATRHWSVPVLSSGELSLEEHMASGGKKMFAGQDIRLIDLVADSGRYGAFDCLHGEANGRSFAERMQRAGRLNYGSAGPAFVEALMRNIGNKAAWINFVDTRCQGWTEKLDLPIDGQVQRVLARFAIAALAGELATKHGITGWPPLKATQAAFDLFRCWFESRDGVTRLEVDEAIDRTRTYVSQNLQRFLRLDGSGGTMHDGWRDLDWVYIIPESWKAIHGDADAIEMARLHKAAGILRTQKGDSLQFKMGRDVPGRPRVYAVRLAELVDLVAAE
jgi:putative DNA primase/helicase